MLDSYILKWSGSNFNITIFFSMDESSPKKEEKQIIRPANIMCRKNIKKKKNLSPH